MDSELNLTTIYQGRDGQREYRLAVVEDRLFELGYYVVFRPLQSVGIVEFKCRKFFEDDERISLWNLLAEFTGVKAPCDGEGWFPEKKFSRRVCGVKTEWVSWCTPEVKKAGIIDFNNEGGSFKLEVYSAELFSKKLAIWLHEHHEKKWEWSFRTD